MDDLVAFCVEQIALDGEQGSDLARVWQFASEFLSKIQSTETPIESVDKYLRQRIWRLLLRHSEIFIMSGEKVIHGNPGVDRGKDRPVEIPLDPRALEDLDSIVETYGESLVLTTSENKQWISVTGFPKDGNQVPNLHFKLLSCISKARAEGITQTEVAKITKQDPRSLFNRTKRLVELGLITKIPFLYNGNNTYRLTHTKFLDATAGPLESHAWPHYSLHQDSGTHIKAGLLTDREGQGQLPRPGLRRDRPVASQIVKAIGDEGWEKKGLYATLMADNYRTPIEFFLEKAHLPKPTPTPRIIAKPANRRSAEVGKKPLHSTTPGNLAHGSQSLEQHSSSLTSPRVDGPEPIQGAYGGTIPLSVHTITSTRRTPIVKRKAPRDSTRPHAFSKRHRVDESRTVAEAPDPVNERQLTVVNAASVPLPESQSYLEPGSPSVSALDRSDPSFLITFPNPPKVNASVPRLDRPSHGNETALQPKSSNNSRDSGVTSAIAIIHSSELPITAATTFEDSVDTAADSIPSKRKRLLFHEDDDRIILQAVSLIKKYVDSQKTPWSMLKVVMPERRESSIRKRYQTIEREMKSYIVQFLQTFDQRYAEAQRRGEVKPIENGPSFDLEYCLNWFKKGNYQIPQELPSALRTENSHDLPRDLSDLELFFDRDDSHELPQSWRTEYYKKEGTSQRRRQEALYSEAFITRQGNYHTEDLPDETKERLESLLKAILLTPDELHDKEKARELLTQYGHDMVEQTIRSLLDRRLLTKLSPDHPSGRRYRMSDKWNLNIRSPITGDVFVDGQAFFEFLDSSFKKGNDVLVSEMANDGSIFCILSLVASQQVTLRPASHDFFTTGDLTPIRGRALDKDKLQFDVIVSKADGFNSPPRLCSSRMAPPRDPDELQAWITPDGKVLEKQLETFKTFVHAHIHTRPAITKGELLQIGGGILTNRECDVLLQSLLEDGIIKKTITEGFVTAMKPG